MDGISALGISGTKDLEGDGGRRWPSRERDPDRLACGFRRGVRLREIGRTGFDLDLVGAGLKYHLLPEQEGAGAGLFRAEGGVGPMPQPDADGFAPKGASIRAETTNRS